MAKIAESAAKTIESNIDYAAFDASKATDQLRAFTEKGVEQSKEVYSKMKSGAEETQKALESTFETAKSASTDLSLKAIAAVRANTEAALSHVEQLVSARSLSEVIELQTAFLRKRFELGVEQVKDMQGATTKAAEEVSRPFKAILDKGMTELKVA